MCIGLLDDKGGEREILLGVDDQLLKREYKAIPREDVAELCVQCLNMPEAKNRCGFGKCQCAVVNVAQACADLGSSACSL